MKIEAIDDLHHQKLKSLGITADMEKAVINWLKEVGALKDCASADGTCSGSCDSGYYCKKLHNNNCLCVKSS